MATLAQALLDRYEAEDTEAAAGGDEIVIFAPSGLLAIRAASFRGTPLSGLGDTAVLVRCKRLRDLDVSETGVGMSAPAVITACAVSLPALQCLNVSGLPLGAWQDDVAGDAAEPSAAMVPATDKLRELVFDWRPPVEATHNATAGTCVGVVNASQVAVWAAAWLPVHCRKLRSLSLSGWAGALATGGSSAPVCLPRLQTHAHGPASLPFLSTLRLDSCGICDFGAIVSALGHLPNLRNLSLAGNPIRSTVGSKVDVAPSHASMVPISLGASLPSGNSDEVPSRGAGEGMDASCASEAGSGSPACAADAGLSGGEVPVPAAPADAGYADGAMGALTETDFCSLVTLNLADALIADWESVRGLGRLASLRNLRLTGNPLLERYEDDIGRMLCISQLPNISSGGAGLQTVGSETCGKLNGAAVTRSDRREAEAFAERWDNGEWMRFRKACGRSDGRIDPVGTASGSRHGSLPATHAHAPLGAAPRKGGGQSEAGSNKTVALGRIR